MSTLGLNAKAENIFKIKDRNGRFYPPKAENILKEKHLQELVGTGKAA